MHIIIKKNKIPFLFYVPLSVIKWKCLLKGILKKKNKEDEYENVQQFANDLYSALKKYIKKNGHFFLVDMKVDEKKLSIRIKV